MNWLAWLAPLLGVLLLGCADRGTDGGMSSASGTSSGGTESSDAETGGPTSSATTDADGTSSSDTGNATTATTTATSTSSDPTTVGETGRPECPFSGPADACEEPYCVRGYVRPYVQTADGWCLGSDTYAHCLDCYAFDKVDVLCKDGETFEVSGICDDELVEWESQGYTVCDPPVVDPPGC